MGVGRLGVGKAVQPDYLPSAYFQPQSQPFLRARQHRAVRTLLFTGLGFPFGSSCWLKGHHPQLVHSFQTESVSSNAGRRKALSKARDSASGGQGEKKRERWRRESTQSNLN